LYAGTARYYPQGRVPYSGELIDRLVEALGLDGRGRLLDVGCGPGSLTLLLAVHFDLHATTHQGIEGDGPLPHPRPPRQEIGELVRRYLGPHRRAGKGTLPERPVSEPERGRLEAEVYRAAGFTDHRRIDVPGYVVERSTDDVVASVFSLSSATPHLFADRLSSFEADLRALLRKTNPDGLFSEQMRETAVDIWKPYRDQRDYSSVSIRPHRLGPPCIR
jgi:hypothetical protein